MFSGSRLNYSKLTIILSAATKIGAGKTKTETPQYIKSGTIRAVDDDTDDDDSFTSILFMCKCYDDHDLNCAIPFLSSLSVLTIHYFNVHVSNDYVYLINAISVHYVDMQIDVTRII